VGCCDGVYLFCSVAVSVGFDEVSIVLSWMSWLLGLVVWFLVFVGISSFCLIV